MLNFTFDPKKETIAQYTARTQAEIAAQNPNDPNSARLTESLPSLPDTQTSPEPQLPDTSQSSPLLTFAQSLDAVVNNARKNRNKAMLDIMAPYRGTVAASDFNSILDHMNAASDRTAQDYIKSVTPQTPDIVTATSDNGDVTGIDKVTGKILWTAKGVGNRQKDPTPKEEDDSGAAMKDAYDAISKGADPEIVRREFLAEYPTKATTWDSYFTNVNGEVVYPTNKKSGPNLFQQALGYFMSPVQ